MLRNEKLLKFLPLLFFLAIFTFIFVIFREGVGNNWDWNFPYFREHEWNLFVKYFSAWSPTGFGQGLGYSSSAYFGFVQAITGLFAQPEVAQAVIVAGLLGGSATVLFFHLRDRGKLLAITVAAAAVFNPAIFYKLLAGHLNYLFGYSVFICLITCLLTTLDTFSRKRIVFLGVLFGLSITQIQFLVFSLITLISFAVFRSDRLSWKALVAILLIGGSLHLYWLLPILAGSSSVSELSSVAKTDSFPDLMAAGWKSIAVFTFSAATFIKDFYPKILLVFMGLLYPLTAYALFTKKQIFRDKYVLFLLSLCIIFVFLVTGIFHKINVPILSILYPMLREVGHAAPLVILSLLLLFAKSIESSKLTKYVWLFFSVWVIANAVIYYQYVPRVNFEKTRAQFDQFQTVIEGKTDTDRVLTYPFFNQYSITGETTRVIGGQPKSNSGWDSFTIFSGIDYVDNAVSPSNFTKSLQYQFLQSYDVDVLSDFNVRYIYDYSKIYSSNYDKFVAREVYGDPELIRNDPEFLQKIMERNMGKVRLHAPNVIEIINFKPRVSGEGVSYRKVNESRYEVRIDGLVKSTNLEFLSNYHNGWKLYQSSLTESDWSGCSRGECMAKNRWVVGDELSYLFKNSVFDNTRAGDETFGNSWNIQNNGETLYLTLYFLPNSYAMVGWLISLTTLVTAGVLLIVPTKRLQKG